MPATKLGQLLDHAWIAARIPHQGTMCLLQSVENWNEAQIMCLASSHRDANNPLRAHGRLGAACGIEYAAQAMAVHGALLTAADKEGARAGYLVSIRATELYVPRLDDMDTDLLIRAGRITLDENNMLYQFSIESDGKQLLAGRAAVIINAAAIT